MTLWLIVVLSASLVSALFMCLWLVRPPCVRRQVIVNTRDQAFRGVLWRQRGTWLVLREVELLAPAEPPRPLDGETIVRAADVSFIQIPPPPSAARPAAVPVPSADAA